MITKEDLIDFTPKVLIASESCSNGTSKKLYVEVDLQENITFYVVWKNHNLWHVNTNFDCALEEYNNI